jgi:hypothetical protein
MLADIHSTTAVQQTRGKNCIIEAFGGFLQDSGCCLRGGRYFGLYFVLFQYRYACPIFHAYLDPLHTQGGGTLSAKRRLTPFVSFCFVTTEIPLSLQRWQYRTLGSFTLQDMCV